ncbi:MAG: hypothetical protein HY247_05935 [archaeon]|nr:MAG: hypothetical protein HY247_05935 [archaeon]
MQQLTKRPNQFRYVAECQGNRGFFKTKAEADAFSDKSGDGEITKVRVEEPHRLFGVARNGREYRLWSSEDAGKPLNSHDLPVDRYFYHNTRTKRLDSIRRFGLRSTIEPKWRLAQYGESVPLEPERRLYLYASEDDGLSYLRGRLPPNTNPDDETPLRFPRELLDGRPVFFDGRYDGRIMSIRSVEVRIPPKYLEVCYDVHTLYKKKERIRTGSWTSLV